MYRNANRGRWTRQLLLIALVAAVLGAIAIGTVPGPVAADHANTTNDRIQIVDAYDSYGNTTVAVRATTTESVSDLQFIYDNGTEVGPLSITNGVENATYNNQTEFTSGDSFSAGENDTVAFELNQSWESGQAVINASAGGTSYDTADQANRSVLTTNVHNVTVENASNSQLTSPAVLFVSNTSSVLHEYVFTQGGTDVLHCGGVIDGSSCTDPDTNGSAHTYAIQRFGKPGAKALPADPRLRAFVPSTANGSAATDLAAGDDPTLTANESAAPISTSVTNYTGGEFSDIEEIQIENRSSGATVQRWVAGVSPGGPLFASPKTGYDLVIERSTETYRRPMTLPTKGFVSREFRVAGGSPPATSEVVGQVRNESGSPVENVTVTAEPSGWGGDPPAFNSTTTDQYGVFTMELPETGAIDNISGRYQFKLSSTELSDGTLNFFPTRDDRRGDGYEVRQSRTILPPLEIQRGSEVDINVTNGSGGAIASTESLTSLSRTTTATGDRSRNALLESVGLFSFPGTEISESVIRVPAPTTSAQDDVSYNVWGFAAQPVEGQDEPETVLPELCAQQIDVSQGVRSSSDCELESGGTLNITLSQYDSVIQRSSTPDTVRVGEQLYDNAVIIRNASTGNVTTYLGPRSIQQFFVDSEGETLSVPVPAGNYTVEVRPTDQFIDRTSVRNTTSFSVSENETVNADLVAGTDFVIEPDFDRSDRTLRRTENNTLALDVFDPATDAELTDTEVNVSLRLLYPNGTVAESATSLGYNTTAGSFDTVSYQPNVDAGEYLIELQVSHENGTSSYNSTIRDGIRVSDFATELWTQRQRVQSGESFKLDLRAYNRTADPPEAIDADKTNVTLALYDRDRNRIFEQSGIPASSITNGEGTIEFPGIPDTGLYRMTVVVEADDTKHAGLQGTADTWIRISDYGVDVDVDKSVYTPGETVTADVSVTDVNGDPVDGATIESTVGSENGSVSVSNATDSNGEATVELDPDTLFADGQWDGPTFLRVKATIETATGVKEPTGGTGIDVRSFQSAVWSTQDQYQSGTTPVVKVGVPDDVDIDSVNATRINGNEIDVSGENVTEENGLYRIELDSDLTSYGVASNGTFRVQVEATNANGRTATSRTRFEVSSLNVRARPANETFSYSSDEDVTVETQVRYANGSHAASESVSIELIEKREFINNRDDPDTVNSTTVSTDQNGEAETTFSPASTGVLAVVVKAGGSERIFPVLVSDINTEFVDESNNPVDGYEFTPGQTDATINVSAGNTDGELLVRALIDGKRELLGTSNITDGNAGVEFSIPESANTGSYPVEAFVRNGTTGEIDRETTRIELTASADTASLETDVAELVYAPGDDAQIRAAVSNSTGPIPDETVRFTLLSESTERELTTATTGDDGTVTVSESIPTNLTDGEYGVRATLPDRGGTSAFDGLVVSSLNLSVDTNKSAYAAGDTVGVNLSDTADGAEGGVRIRLNDGSTVTESFNRSGETAPYTVAIDLPEDDAAVGTRTVEAFVRDGQSVAVDSTSVDVFNASENATLSVPETIVADGSGFDITANATVSTNASLAVFSPGTSSVAYADEVALNDTRNVSLSNPGTYVFELTVPGVGTEVVVRNVGASSDDPEVSVGGDLTTNSTEFTTGENITIKTTTEGMTAEVFSPSGSVTVPLNRNESGTYFGRLPSSETSPDPHLVRLDGPNSTDVDSVLIEVTS